MTKQKGFIVPFLIILIIIVIIGGGMWYFYLNKVTAVVPSSDMQATSTLALNTSGTSKVVSGAYDSDLRLSPVRISKSTNSVSTWNAIKSDAILKADSDFLTKYVPTYSSKNIPPLAESQKILDKYPKLLAVFDANANQPYQCLFILGDQCSLNTIRSVSYLVGLRAIVQIQQKKPVEAQQTASNIVALGKNVTANTDSLITLLVGWVSQQTGYNLLTAIGPKTKLTKTEKAALIAQLRKEHKTVLKYTYTNAAEGFAYITSAKNKPTRLPDADEEEYINELRETIAANPKSWNQAETQKYFYDSYKIAIANVDLACGATPVNSKLDLTFDPEDEDAENYIGKTLYTDAYASLDIVNEKRCAIEKLIQGL